MKPETAAVRVREATFSDATAICEVLKRNSMGSTDPEAWASRWKTYPFAAEFAGIPIGWVLETEPGTIVGSIDNIQILYSLGNKRLKGVIAAGWAVDPDYRGKAMQLMTTFFRQKGVDLWLNVSASPATAQIMAAMRIARIPIPDYGFPCFWPTRRQAFAKAALQKKAIPGAAILSWPAGLALWLRDVYRGSGRGRLTGKVRQLTQFGERFDTFGESLVQTGANRLHAVRNAEVLQWRFQAELRAQHVSILAAERDSALLGYAVLVRRKDPALGLTLCDVADLQAGNDDPAILRDLLLASIHSANESGADALKFMSGTPVKRSAATALSPYTYSLPIWQQYFKTNSPELTTGLSTAAAWDFSLFDTF